MRFTTADWDAVQMITLMAQQDDDSTDGTAIFEHLAHGDTYGDAPIMELQATEIDDDERAILFSAATLSVPEGGSSVYGVKLGSAPSGVLNLSVFRRSDSDLDLTVVSEGGARTGAILVFDASNWNSYQSVTVAATPDGDAATGTGGIVHLATGSDYDGIRRDLSIRETDDDAELALANSSLLVPEGGRAEYEVELAARPGGPVFVTVSRIDGGDEDLTVNGHSEMILTFTTEDWDRRQPVAIAAAEDDDALAGTARFRLSSSGSDFEFSSELVATEIDKDRPNLVLDPASLTVPEGETAVYSVRLATRPASSVAVTVETAKSENMDRDISIATSESQTVLLFSTEDWSVARQVTLTAAADDDPENGTAAINHIASGGDYDSVTAILLATEADKFTKVDRQMTREFLDQAAIAAHDHVEAALSERFFANGAQGFSGKLAGGEMAANPFTPEGGDQLVVDGLPAFSRDGLVRSEPTADPLSLERALSGTNFTLGGGSEGGHFGSLWLRGAVSSFETKGESPVEGDAWSVTIGADYAFKKWVAGLAVSRIKTDSDYGSGSNMGRLEATVTGFYPYFSYQASPRLSVWGAIGFGRGDLEITPAGSTTLRTAIAMRQITLGARHAIVTRSGDDGFDLAIDGNLRWLRTATDAAPDLPEFETESVRLRTGVEASWRTMLDSGASWITRAGVAAQYDDGASGKGAGITSDLGIDWKSPQGTVKIGLLSRTLLAHQVDDRKEWTLSATIVYDPDPGSEHGFSAKMSPSWKTGSISRPVAAANPAEALGGVTERTARAGLRGELGYGFPELGGLASGTLSAFGEIEEEARRVGLGYSFDLLSRDGFDVGFAITADAERRDERFHPRGAEVRWTLDW